LFFDIAIAPEITKDKKQPCPTGGQKKRHKWGDFYFQADGISA
jgi:hypothetical protein